MTTLLRNFVSASASAVLWTAQKTGLIKDYAIEHADAFASGIPPSAPWFDYWTEDGQEEARTWFCKAGEMTVIVVEVRHAI